MTKNKTIPVTHFDECPNCGYRLMAGLGVLFKCTQLMTKNGFDDLDIEETLGYYCPDCGSDISKELGDKVAYELGKEMLQ